ncbi:RDD family protein [Oxobacter pfennigii]|uniref:RDD family protein n=1 Tax=Oxobacter pfennigii TaxID=36849 RepID=A0A0P8WL26_9CLOT|nr:RDD family protein [Oxobacter pfennigii]KPU43079.1 RDD family protein [Oxobacter pfennigii]
MGNNFETDVKKTSASLYKSIDYSGFIERAFARGADFAIAAAAGYFIYKLEGITFALLFGFIFDMLHRIIFTYIWGATIGKLLFGVRVISRNSGKLVLGQVIIREFSKYISGAFLNFGYITIIFSRRKRSWHDMVACTVVTSGGRDEAIYARKVYKDSPEKWNMPASASVTFIFTAALIFLVIKTSAYILHDIGMIGFVPVRDTYPEEFTYNVPSSSIVSDSFIKDIIQLGDTDGDGNYEVFKEGIKMGETSINDIRFLSGKPADGKLGILTENRVIQYRLLDMNLDKRDELAVLYEDKSISIYSLIESSREIAKFGPIGLETIISVFKGRLQSNGPCSFYILGDKNKLSVVNIVEGKAECKDYILPGSYNFISADIGIFNDEGYLAAVTEDNRLVFYSFDGNFFNIDKEMDMNIKGKINITIKDINADGKNEMVVMSPLASDRHNGVFAAYDVSGDKIKKIWEGGRTYYHEKQDIVFFLADGADVDKDKRFEAYLVSPGISGDAGKTALFMFESDNNLFKANDILRALSFNR